MPENPSTGSPNIDCGAEVVAELRPPRTAGEAPPPTRQCGRCRLTFEGDPTLHPLAQQRWWLCPACRAVLLPDRSHSHAFRGRPTSMTTAL